jgi:hypothetical protein
MTNRLRFFFLANATEIRITLPATSTISLARFLGWVSWLALSLRPTGDCCQNHHQASGKGSRPLGFTKSRGNAVAPSVGRCTPSVFIRPRASITLDGLSGTLESIIGSELEKIR